MQTRKLLTLGQVAGGLLAAAGAVDWVFDRVSSTPGLMIIGIVLYAGCRLATDAAEG